MDDTSKRTESHQGPVAARRTPLIVGAAAGATILLAWVGYRAYDAAATPARPPIQGGTPEQLIGYIVNPRGLSRLPLFEQDRFLQEWKKHYAGADEQRALKAYLEKAPEESRAAVRDVMYRIGRRQFFENARQYMRIKDDPGQAYQFLMERIRQTASDTAWMRGHGDPTRDLSSVMAVGLPRNPEDLTKLIVSDTTPEERVLGEQYINALKHVREQERKRGGAQVPTISQP